MKKNLAFSRLVLIEFSVLLITVLTSVSTCLILSGRFILYLDRSCVTRQAYTLRIIRGVSLPALDIIHDFHLHIFCQLAYTLRAAVRL